MKTLITLLITLFTINMIHAQTAGNWPLNTNLNGTPGTHVTVSAISMGSAIPSGVFNGSTEWYGEGGWPAGALDPNAYIQFTVTANSGNYLVLNSVTLIQRRSNTGTPMGAGPNNWSLRSSLDNYATDITTGSMTINYATFTVALPAAFQSIPSTVTFRVYGYNTTINSGGSSRFVFDNVSVQGSAHAGVLAAESISLAAKAGEDKNISIQWKAEGFTEGTTYTLQRSSNGVDFTQIFHTTTAQQYNDLAPANIATLYYRIAASLPDGNIYLSPTTAINQNITGLTAIKGVSAQGSAVKSFLHLDGAGNYQVSIWSQDGKPLVRRNLAGQSGDVQTDIAFNYPHGVYILTLAKEGRISSKAFVF